MLAEVDIEQAPCAPGVTDELLNGPARTLAALRQRTETDSIAGCREASEVIRILDRVPGGVAEDIVGRFARIADADPHFAGGTIRVLLEKCIVETETGERRPDFAAESIPPYPADRNCAPAGGDKLTRVNCEVHRGASQAPAAARKNIEERFANAGDCEHCILVWDRELRSGNNIFISPAAAELGRVNFRRFRNWR